MKKHPPLNEIVTSAAIADNNRAVSMRLLFKWLEMDESNFSRDAKRAIETAGLIEFSDYEILLFQNDEQNKQGGHNRTDYILTASAAKEITMMSSKTKGREIRQYFLSIEKAIQNETCNLELKARIAEAEAAKSKNLILLADKLTKAPRGDKALIKKAAYATFGIEPPRRRKSAEELKQTFFTGEKSLAECLKFFGISKKSQDVTPILSEAEIITPGKTGGHILSTQYGRTLRPNGHGRPMFTFDGAKAAFKKAGIL
jgi:phage anti-repressor protein